MKISYFIIHFLFSASYGIKFGLFCAELWFAEYDHYFVKLEFIIHLPINNFTVSSLLLDDRTNTQTFIICISAVSL